MARSWIKQWLQASCFLSDPFKAFDYGYGVSHSLAGATPALLYVLNGNGLPVSPRSSDSSNAEVRQLKASVEALQQQANTGARAFEAVLTQQQQFAQQLRDQSQHAAAGFACLSTVISGTTCVQAASTQLMSLEAERRTSQVLLALKPEAAPAITNQLQGLDSAISTQRTELTQAQQSLGAAQNLLPAFTSTAPQPLPAPTPLSVSASQSARTRTLADLDHELSDGQRRQRARTDSGPPPPPSDSPIQVDSVNNSVLPSPAYLHRPASSAVSLTSAVPSAPRPLSFVSNSSPVQLSPFVLFSLFLFLLSLLPSASAAVPSSQALSIFSLNANGLHDAMKINAVKQHLSTSLPHVWVISETKSSAPVASRIFVSGYNTFESPALRTSSSTSKWGVIAAVRRDLHCERVPAPDALNGRAIVLDVTIPTSSARGFVLRIIAAYAPWDPGGPHPNPQQFWGMLTPLCNTAPSQAWCLIGDCNLTLTSEESSGSHAPTALNRSSYLEFLWNTHGADLWTAREDRSALTHYTFSRGSSRSILDRAAHSLTGVITGSIDIAPLYVGATDHRPISVSLLLAHPRLGNAFLLSRPTGTHNPRFRYPFRDTRCTLDSFASLVDNMISDRKLADTQVHDDDSFVSLYHSLTQVLLSAASSTFQVSQPPRPTPRLRNQTIRLILRETRRLGRLIYATRTGPGTLDRLCARYSWALLYVTAFRSLPANQHLSTYMPLHLPSFLPFLTRTHRALNKLRYHEERSEASALETRLTTARINRVLLGSSPKILYPNLLASSPPVALQDPTVPTQLLTEGEEIKAATVSYFSHLYHHSQPPPTPKPWLSSPSVLSIHDRIQKDPFLWPQELTLDSLRSLLRKGNAWPAPGPDRWEKWFLKALSDSSLTLVLRLLNYEILTSHIPDAVKPSTISTIFKRGSRLDLTNYRGICCSNFLLSAPFAWLNHCLGPYLTRHAVIPAGQIATQPGVQGRDLTSLFAQIESWASREHVPLYALCRDQQKGFNRLSPQGFYDAVCAYGLPPELIKLDSSAQTNVPYSIRTAFGLTDTLTVSGVTKQGGPLSPLKSTLTTSLGHHWLNDMASGDPHALLISTHQARRSCPHTPPDHI